MTDRSCTRNFSQLKRTTTTPKKKKTKKQIELSTPRRGRFPRTLHPQSSHHLLNPLLKTPFFINRIPQVPQFSMHAVHRANHFQIDYHPRAITTPDVNSADSGSERSTFAPIASQERRRRRRREEGRGEARREGVGAGAVSRGS